MKLANLINLNDSGSLQNRNTMLTILLFIYLFIASNSTKNLFSGQLTRYIDNNRYAQHVIAFLTIVVMITYLGNMNNNMNIILCSGIIYLWFLATTKMDLGWNMLIIGLLVVAFLFQNRINSIEDLGGDPNLDKSDKKKIVKGNDKKKKLLLAVILMISAAGVGFYVTKKKGQYGGNFDVNKFSFGGVGGVL